MAHPNKEIAAALEYAEKRGWRVVQGGSHAWGKMYCPHNDPECRCGEFCIQSIWSTPKNAGNHAKLIRRVVDNCIIRKRSEEEKNELPGGNVKKSTPTRK